MPRAWQLVTNEFDVIPCVTCLVMAAALGHSTTVQSFASLVNLNGLRCTNGSLVEYDILWIWPASYVPVDWISCGHNLRTMLRVTTSYSMFTEFC